MAQFVLVVTYPDGSQNLQGDLSGKTFEMRIQAVDKAAAEEYAKHAAESLTRHLNGGKPPVNVVVKGG